MDPLPGRLVVATHDLTDRNFVRTVVLILAYDPEEGAAGVVLNRPTPADAPERLAAWARFAPPPQVVFRGGPVALDAVIGLAGLTSDDEPPGWQRVDGRTGVVDLSEPPDALADAQVRWVRLYSGYAGWSAGQLEDEIASGAWFVVDGRDDDGCTADPDGLWRAVLARQGGLFTTVPEDPALN